MNLSSPVSRVFYRHLFLFNSFRIVSNFRQNESSIKSVSFSNCKPNTLELVVRLACCQRSARDWQLRQNSWCNGREVMGSLRCIIHHLPLSARNSKFTRITKKNPVLNFICFWCHVISRESYFWRVGSNLRSVKLWRSVEQEVLFLYWTGLCTCRRFEDLWFMLIPNPFAFTGDGCHQNFTFISENIFF